MISLKIQNLENVTAKLGRIPPIMEQVATRAAADVLMGDDREGLRAYPARVQHGPDNPYQWQSERQRRAFFATNGFGRGIPTMRTDQLREGWHRQAIPHGQAVINEVPYAAFVQGNQLQRGHLADKWRNYAKTLKAMSPKMIRAAMAAVRDAIRIQKLAP